jgi:hypothetical protein
VNHEITWWVWSLGSSNSWTTCRSLESRLLCTDLSRLVFDFSYNLLPMIGLQIRKNYALIRSLLDRWKQYSCSKPLLLDVNNVVRTYRQIQGVARSISAICQIFCSCWLRPIRHISGYTVIPVSHRREYSTPRCGCWDPLPVGAVQ